MGRARREIGGKTSASWWDPEEKLAREEQVCFGREGTEPFSAEPVAKDVSQKQAPTLLLSPSLRNGGKALQGVAHDGDGCDELLPIFMLQADSDGALAAMPDQPGDSSEQSGATRDRFTMVLGIVEPHVRCHQL